MLVDGREDMVRRAIQSFRDQSYSPAKRILLAVDTGKVPVEIRSFATYAENEAIVTCSWSKKKEIGDLRNWANSLMQNDIIMHWDSDDWSHPDRITEQVLLLQSTEAEAVGYRDMLFWDTRGPGEAWVYASLDTRYCLGTSLCYWRKAWEQRPFEPTSQGEDHRWLKGVKSFGATSMHKWVSPPGRYDHPRMIASIHGGNTSNAYTKENMQRSEWTRTPQWDEYCREKMGSTARAEVAL